MGREEVDGGPDDEGLVEAAGNLLRRCDHILMSLNIEPAGTANVPSQGKTKPSRSGGVSKFISTVQAERRFISKCSNLAYLEAVFSIMSVIGVQSTNPRNRHGAPEVFKAVHYVPVGRKLPLKRTIRVDIVMNGGMKWVKIKAGRMDGVALELENESSDEEDDDDETDTSNKSTSSPKPAPESGHDMIPILRQATEMLEAAKQNPVHYKPPEIVWVFSRPSSDVPDLEHHRVMEVLRQQGVQAMDASDFLAQIAEGDRKIADEVEFLLPDWQTVWTATANLDVTTVITLASDISNQFKKVPKELFSNDALRMQYEQESVEPILYSLVPALEGKELVVTRSALEKYIGIAKLIAGPREKARTLLLCSETLRAEMFKAINAPEEWRDMDQEVFQSILPLEGRLKVVENSPSDRFLGFVKGSNEQSQGRFTISPLHADVFGTSDHLRITTVTANGALVRSLTKNGVVGLSLYLHEPRSLIETRKKKM
ncbi:hypothetical protein HDU67_003086 [Dinochytrium kinnereticum]|nr:hypothetical protein HDU67_003086 [Dinochytrium kinnereticum]